MAKAGKPVRALLAGLIDYAGLFPPAQLSMAGAVRNYAAYLEGRNSWILGRFVVPFSRLEEFQREAGPLQDSNHPWRLSVLVSRPEDEGTRLESISRDHRGYVIDGVEIKAGGTAAIEAAARSLPASVKVHCEIPLGGDLSALLDALGRIGAAAKVRCGGITPELVPSPQQLAAFLKACAAAGVSFKATAGLHHAVRGSYPLTYEPGSPSARMHGFLNLFLAASWIRFGASAEAILEILEENSAGAFRLLENGVEWRGRRIAGEVIAETRRNFALGFGSCSFREPLEELRAAGLLPSDNREAT